MSEGAGTGQATLRILAAGGGVTLQDAGRHGFLRYGITPAGPMDPLAHATANRALDNPPGATADRGLPRRIVADDGRGRRRRRPGGRRPAHRPRRARAARRRGPHPAAGRAARPSGRAGAGAWCSLAVAGRDRRGAGAGLDGDPHPLRPRRPARARPAGGRHPRGPDAARRGRRALRASRRPGSHRPPDVIRVVLGPQDDLFAASVRDAFLAGPWRIGPRGDRMACFLEGPSLQARSHDIVSDGIAMGAIQVPGSGQPLVLMADRQPTGGYPKIATVIGADLGRLAQAQAGTALRFAAVDLARGGGGAAGGARRPGPGHPRASPSCAPNFPPNSCSAPTSSTASSVRIAPPAAAGPRRCRMHARCRPST